MTWSLRHPESALRPTSYADVASDMGAIAVALSAVVLAVNDDEPVVAVLPADGDRVRLALPGGRFCAGEHDSLDAGLRAAVERQTGLGLRQTRQIAAAAMRAGPGNGAPTPVAPVVLDISYLALVAPGQVKQRSCLSWLSWYQFFPWEDWRHGRPAILSQDIEPSLRAWAAAEPACQSDRLDRAQRVRLCFGCDGAAWDEEKVVERYQLMCEAGLVRDRDAEPGEARAPVRGLSPYGRADLGQYGPVLAGAIAELRRLIKYRPVVFELMDEVFTLFELQKTVEAILGPH